MKPEFPPYMPLPALEPDTEFFWKAAREGRLVMMRCSACGWIVHPARPVCSRCRGRELAQHELSGRGRVVAWTVNHQRWMPGLEEPYAIAIVELAEQANLRLTTNVVDTPPERLRVDLPVRVRFREASEEIGLPVFEEDPSPEGAAALAASRARTAPEPEPTTATARVLAHPPRRVAPEERLERRAILSGVGQSRVGRRLMRSDMDLTAEAALAAIADAGLEPKDVDGIASYPGAMGAAPPGFAGPGIVEVQDALGLSVNWHLAGPEGSAQIAPVIAACLAVAAGLCRHALVYRTVSEATAAARGPGGGGRQGIGAGSRSIGGFGAWLIPFGAMSAANWIAVSCVRHMHEFGTKREHLGAIAVAGRKHAALNPNAVYRDPMTMDDYLAARMISWPFGLFDCDAPCDGSTAV
ncbi:MAG: OB-fold domain-containing protein, partial [Alphaproteobacteria bacterium]